MRKPVQAVFANDSNLPDATAASTSSPATICERGLTRPASGSHKAPWIMLSSNSGKRALASAGVIISTRLPKAFPEATRRLSSCMRSSSPTRATSKPPMRS